MSIVALESNYSSGNDRIQRSTGFIHGMSSFITAGTSGGGGGDQRFGGERRAAMKVENDDDNDGDSCSSSSIGRNSDDDLSDGEVQSSLRSGGGGLNSLNGLEQVLPIKRGISTYYAGRSKSFTSLGDAENFTSVEEIAKPEDAYTRKRKNLLAHSIFFLDKNKNALSRSSSSGGISKRLASSNRSTLALGFTMASSVSSNNEECSILKSSSPFTALPPLPPHGRRQQQPNNEPSSPRSPWRSFSLSDLQCATAATPQVTNSVKNSKEEGDS